MREIKRKIEEKNEIKVQKFNDNHGRYTRLLSIFFFFLSFVQGIVAMKKERMK